MRNAIAVLALLMCSITSAAAQVSVGVGLPGVSIGINLPVYPQLVPVPGYPVYYAPQLNSNYFFYDGMYWVFDQDNWYESAWYNGPWQLVGPDAVPLFLLRVPVRYYRRPPQYFRGWASNGPPRWDRHWGNRWAESHRGWDRWNRNAVPARAPLPSYQRQYSGNRYPRAEQQQTLRSQNYRYQPRSAGIQQPSQPPRAQGRPASRPQSTQATPQPRNAPPQTRQATPQPRNTPPQARQAMPQPRNAPPQTRNGAANERRGTEKAVASPAAAAPRGASPPQARPPAQGRGPQGNEPARGQRKGRENERGKDERGGDHNG
jgi:hypothetical protein